MGAKVGIIAGSVAIYLLGVPVYAQQLVGEYSTYISDQDLYNSSGERLTRAWQILGQDRANFHRFNRPDREDQYDDFFSNPKNRENAERIIMRDPIPPSIENAIVQGDVLVNVKIWGRGNTGYYITVDLR